MLPSPENSVDKRDKSLTKKKISNSPQAETQKMDLVERDIKIYERLKTSEEIKIIEYVNTRFNKLMEKYQLKGKDISLQQIYILKSEFFNKTKEKSLAEKVYPDTSEKPRLLAGFVPEFQEIFVEENDSLSVFYHRIVHEFAEYKTYQEFEITKDKTKARQLGISYLTESGVWRFENLKEGIIERLIKEEFYKGVLEDHDLSKDLRQELEFTEARKKDLLLNKGELLSFLQEIQNQSPEFKSKISGLSETERIDLAKNMASDICSVKLPSVFPFQKKEQIYELFSYPVERRILNSLLIKLYAKNQNLGNPEEIFDLFKKSLFTGKFEWKELVEKSFGEGTFEKLGELDEKPEELEKFVNGL